MFNNGLVACFYRESSFASLRWGSCEVVGSRLATYYLDLQRHGELTTTSNNVAFHPTSLIKFQMAGNIPSKADGKAIILSEDPDKLEWMGRLSFRQKSLTKFHVAGSTPHEADGKA